ncbi:hypothetical protein IDH32_05280 [Pelagibacterales bacterium SAG-MED01]|nr:hypothetical protein [Pelagibacterales bacterium SAG-MED01]
MNYRIIITFFLIFFIYGCGESPFGNNNKAKFKIEKRFKNSGFALIYSDNLKKIKKLDNRSLTIHHKKLKRKSMVKITNLKNGKSLIAEVKSNKVNFSDFYNSVITERIAENLELNINEPYIEIVLISKNSTFVAKKSKTFDEEKEVAEKAPIDGIQINDLNNTTKLDTTKKENESFSYSIKIADFFYNDTAKMMIDRINKETSLKNSRIIKISKTKFRVLIGPFNDIKSLKESFEKMHSLNFENIEILRNV